LFGCFFFFIIKFYFLKNYLYIYYSGDVDVINYLFLTDLISSHSYLVTIFYILFTVTVITLALLNWRDNDFIIEKLQLFESMYGVIIFYSIWAKSMLYTPIVLYKFIDVLSTF
jgi:hypothetical protein